MALALMTDDTGEFRAMRQLRAAAQAALVEMRLAKLSDFARRKQMDKAIVKLARALKR
jgi:hypothetical protein